VVDTIHNRFHGVNLVGAHHEQFLLALDEHHVAADHTAEFALLKESVGEVDKEMRAVGDDLNRSIGDPAAGTGAPAAETASADTASVAGAALPPPGDPASTTAGEAKV
jgi:hypothetical protein